jgi:hypothetical protein
MYDPNVRALSRSNATKKTPFKTLFSIIIFNLKAGKDSFLVGKALFLIVFRF